MKYTITNGKFTLTAESYGAEQKSLKDANGKDYLWTSNPEHWGSSSPHLFPVVCSLKDGKTEIYGKTYNIEKHGFARKKEYELFEKKEDEITFLLKEDEETLSCYPFKFEFYVTHKLTDTGCETIYKVKNTDEKLMYYSVGGHPGFNCPMNEGESFSDYDIEFEKTETCTVYQSTLDDLGGLLHKEGINKDYMNIDSFSLNYDTFKKDALIFEKINSKWIRLVNRNTKKGVHFSYEGFNALGIWTPYAGGAPFICLEPWTNIPDKDDASGIFSERPYTKTLEQGCSHTYSYKTEIL